jgi:hypothetical protein
MTNSDNVLFLEAMSEVTIASALSTKNSQEYKNCVARSKAII